MDTDLLGSFGLRLESTVYSDGSYSLYRVNYQGRKLIAEISDISGVYQHRWPSVGGLIQPISARDLPDQRKLLLFDIGTGKFLCELTEAIGRFSSERALELTRMVLRIVSDLQAAGMISGYLGPEMFVAGGSIVRCLAGRRGIPVSPFTPPEIHSSRPSDPRSDVSAIGSFLFRLVAGTDDREEQMHIWQILDPDLQVAIQSMVAPSVVGRPNGLKAVLSILDDLNAPKPVQEAEELIQHDEGFLRSKKKNSGSSRSKKWFWIIGSVIVLALASVAFFFSGPPLDTGEDPVFVDNFPDEQIEVESPWVEDTVSTIENGNSLVTILLEDTAKVWISNCTGVTDIEFEFRAGEVSHYSHVYPLSGTTNRQFSLILARRSDPSVPLGGTSLGTAVYQLADTLFTVKAVDLTIMLGTDLNYPGINGGFLNEPVAPAGTLFVDVVNHGLQYELDNMPAAAWTASKINGMSCEISGVEWLISVCDVRDADRFNEDIGIPELLVETIFLHKESSVPAGHLETLLRQYFQPLPDSAEFPVETIPVPDIHILMGQSVSH
ncbi:MAG: hypothetical protein KAH54_04420 [Candidatus Sabulitectum sp.]|nr:hypothetical protein [Candidatus Sabulitectum sp.]